MPGDEAAHGVCISQFVCHRRAAYAGESPCAVGSLTRSWRSHRSFLPLPPPPHCSTQHKSHPDPTWASQLSQELIRGCPDLHWWLAKDPLHQ